MDILTTDSIVSILLGVALLMAFRMMPRLMAGGVPFVGPDVVKSRMDKGENVLVIDVRTAGEFTGELGRLPGSLNIDGSTLSQRINELGPQLEQHKDHPVVVTCRTHNRSPKPAKMLKAAGFKDVAVLKGGVSAWSRAGHPTEHG